MVDESFVPSTHQPSVLYWRLTDFWTASLHIFSSTKKQSFSEIKTALLSGIFLHFWPFIIHYGFTITNGHPLNPRVLLFLFLVKFLCYLLMICDQQRAIIKKVEDSCLQDHCGLEGYGYGHKIYHFKIFIHSNFFPD